MLLCLVQWTPLHQHLYRSDVSRVVSLSEASPVRVRLLGFGECGRSYWIGSLVLAEVSLEADEQLHVQWRMQLFYQVMAVVLTANKHRLEVDVHDLLGMAKTETLNPPALCF